MVTVRHFSPGISAKIDVSGLRKQMLGTTIFLVNVEMSKWSGLPETGISGIKELTGLYIVFRRYSATSLQIFVVCCPQDCMKQLILAAR